MKNRGLRLLLATYDDEMDVKVRVAILEDDEDEEIVLEDGDVLEIKNNNRSVVVASSVELHIIADYVEEA
jgi:hypothetical protein